MFTLLRPIQKPRRIFASTLLLGLLSVASGQGLGGFKLPADYSSRFGATSALMDRANSVYGVRYLPLPFSTDVRIFYVNRPTYAEYGLYSRLSDTDVLLGQFEGGVGGVGTAKLDHNPDQGAQFTTLLQGSGVASEAYLNYTQAGYAQRWGVFRLYAAAGYGFTGTTSAGYTNLVASGGKNFKLGKFNLNLSATFRNWLYPATAQQFTSADFVAGLGGPVTDTLSASASHFERVAFGTDVLGFGPGAYRESRLNLTYKPKPSTAKLSLRNAQFDAYRIWNDAANLNNRYAVSLAARAKFTPLLALEATPSYDFYFGLAALKAALLFDLPQLGSAVGPSIKYTYKSADSTWTGNAWQFGLVITDK